MNIRLQQEDFAQALSLVQRATATRSTLPVLTGILLEAHNGQLKLSSTDLEIGLHTTTMATVEEEGAVVLPARYIVELVRRAPAGEIQLSTEGERAQAVVRFGRSHYKINGFPQEQFPTLPREMPASAATLPQDHLRTAIEQTHFSVSAQELRPVLTGIQIRLGAQFEALSTDGFRVSHFTVEGTPQDEAVEVVAPGRALQELARLLDHGEENAQIAVDENRLLVKANDVLFHTSLLNGQFPAVLEMMPKDYVLEAKVDRRAFTEACEREALIATVPDGSNVLRMNIVDNITLTAQAPDIGVAEDVVEAELQGDELTIAVNAKYLLDGLHHIEGEMLRLSFSGSESPALLRGEDDGYQYFVLPLRLS